MPETDRLSVRPRSYLAERAVTWFTNAGIEVVPIPILISDAEARAYVQSVNGLYFQGGPSLEPNYVHLVKSLLANAMALNKPVWGTCHGFQMLVMLLGGVYPLDDIDAMRRETSVLTPYGKGEGRLPLHKMRIPYEARLFSHQHGITLAHFLGNPALMRTFRILATTRDRAGTVYVSAIEGLTHPLYGVQFHPENDRTGALDWMVEFFKKDLEGVGEGVGKGVGKGVGNRVGKALDITRQTLYPCPSAWQDYAHHKGENPHCYVFEARPKKI